MASQSRGARCASVAVLAGALLAGSAGAEFKPEEVVVAPPITAKSRAYVLDIAINHIADGKIHIVDGDTMRYLGVLGSGFTGQVVLSANKKELIIVTGYLSRGQRGERADIVEVWDADTLEFKHEIPISNKRAMALNYEGLVRLSSDGRWLLSQNATPATSVEVVDMQGKKSMGDVPTPGCWGIYPSQSNPNRFSTLCGDGTMATITLDGSGGVASRTNSQKIFDPDEDAWFMSGEQSGDTYYFVSFKGNLAAVNAGGDTAVLEGAWPLVGGADAKKNWRPGGYQPLAVHGDRAYVTMHPGGAEGSHKNPAAEIWVIDLAKKRRVARMPGNDAVALETSEDGFKLYALNPVKAELVVYDKIGPKPRVRTLQVGEATLQLVAH
jgi:methylamine dehydrogenase heavy chain